MLNKTVKTITHIILVFRYFTSLLNLIRPFSDLFQSPDVQILCDIAEFYIVKFLLTMMKDQ